MFCGQCHTLLPVGWTLDCEHHVCITCLEHVEKCTTCGRPTGGITQISDEDLYPGFSELLYASSLESKLTCFPARLEHKRYAKDWHLYTQDEFLGWYGDRHGRLLWDQSPKLGSEELYVSALNGYVDAIEHRISDHGPLVFTVAPGCKLKTYGWRHSRIACWNILKQCRQWTSEDGVSGRNNGFNIRETTSQYSERLKKTADWVVLLIRLCGVVVLQECPPAGTDIFADWIGKIVTSCHVEVLYEISRVDRTMSLVTLWDVTTWQKQSTYELPSFGGRTLACQFQSSKGLAGSLCVLNVHLPYGGPPRSQERHEHTANVAKVLDDFFQETKAFASVAVGDFNLDVFSVVHGMRTSPAQLSAAKMTNNCQVWAGDKKSMRSTVDGAVAYLSRSSWV